MYARMYVRMYSNSHKDQDHDQDQDRHTTRTHDQNSTPPEHTTTGKGSKTKQILRLWGDLHTIDKKKSKKICKYEKRL